MLNEELKKNVCNNTQKLKDVCKLVGVFLKSLDEEMKKLQEEKERKNRHHFFS
jgi:Protein of unknown function (DUF2962).